MNENETALMNEPVPGGAVETPLREAVTAEESGAQTAAPIADSDWEALFAAYPDITAESIPEEALSLILEGVAPVHAMRQAENTRLKAEITALQERLAAAETAEKNRLRGTGSLRGAPAAAPDPVLAGLFFNCV